MDIWGVILGALIGSAASIISTYMNSKSMLDNELESEKIKRENKFKDFQIDSCIKLQTLLNQFLREVIKHPVFYDNTESANEEYKNDIGKLIRKIQLHKERLQNGNLRNEIQMFMNSYTSMETDFYFNEIKEISDTEKMNFIKKYQNTTDLLGKEVRSFY